MADPNWAMAVARRFRARKTREGLQAVRLRRRAQAEGAASGLGIWTDIRDAFARRALLLNAALGEEVLQSEFSSSCAFSLAVKDSDARLKVNFQKARNEIDLDVAGRAVPLKVDLDHRSGEWGLVGAGVGLCTPDQLAENAIAELLDKP